MRCPDAAFQTLIIPSKDTEANILLFIQNVTVQIQSVCPVRGPTRSPACAFHTQIVLSLEPEAIHLPLGEKIMN